MSDERSAETEGGSEASTPERIVEAAERLFAERGYRATSVRAITEAAGSNLAGVNYHFGGKEQLYREVFGRHMKRLREVRLEAIEGVELGGGQDEDLEKLLGVFARAFFAPLVGDANGGRLMHYPLPLLFRN